MSLNPKPVITWKDGLQVAYMPGGETLEVVTAEQMVDDGRWHRLMAANVQMASKNWRTDGKLQEHGKAYLLLGPSHCSACWGQGDQRRDRQYVVMSVNTSGERLHLPAHWHGRWACTDGPNHWSTSQMRWNLLHTGSVTP